MSNFSDIHFVKKKKKNYLAKLSSHKICFKMEVQEKLEPYFFLIIPCKHTWPPSLQNEYYFNKKMHFDTDAVNDITSSHQNVVTYLVIPFL